MYQRMAVMAALSCLILATPALARDRHQTDDAPCDAEGGAFDQPYELVSFATDHDYFADAPQPPAADPKAAPGADDEDDDSAEDPDADSEDDDDAQNPNGCAEIMVTPYDLMLHQPDQKPQWAALRRGRVVWKPETV